MAERASVPPGEGALAELPVKGVRKVWRWAAVISLGGALFGFDTGVISGALLFIKTDFGLTPFEQGAVVSALLVGAIAGALGIGRVADHVGRRGALGLEGVVFLVGTAMAVLAPNYWVLVAARLVLGLAVGAASATVPIYLSELSPTEIRGRVLTMNQLMITIGVLLAYLVNLAFAPAGNWRGMFSVAAIPAAGMVVGALWLLPESAEWLISHGRADTARQVIASVSNEAQADRLIERLRRHAAEIGAGEGGTVGPAGWRTLLAQRVRPALVVGLTVAAVQQFGGINTIIYYAPTIIQQTGLTATNSIFYAVAIGVMNLVMTIVSIKLVDRAGRRPLLLVSLAGMLTTLALLGVAFLMGGDSVLALVFMVLYIVAFGVGLGPVFWVLIGEVFPPDAHAAGASASTTMNWTSNFVVSLAFLPVVNLIGQASTFWIMAGICAAGLWFVWRFVPETRKRDFDQIDAELRTRFGVHRETAGAAPAR